MALVKVPSDFLVAEADGGRDGDDSSYLTLLSLVFGDADGFSLEIFLSSWFCDVGLLTTMKGLKLLCRLPSLLAQVHRCWRKV